MRTEGAEPGRACRERPDRSPSCQGLPWAVGCDLLRPLQGAELDSGGREADVVRRKKQRRRTLSPAGVGTVGRRRGPCRPGLASWCSNELPGPVGPRIVLGVWLEGCAGEAFTPETLKVLQNTASKICTLPKFSKCVILSSGHNATHFGN